MPYRLRRLSLTQWMILITVVLLMILGVGYIERLTTLAAMQAEVRWWEERVAVAEHRQVRLKDYLEYVQSDAYVDHEIRTRWKWSLPGDVPIEVLPETPVDASEDRGEIPVNQESLPWQAWWDYFFGP